MNKKTGSVDIQDVADGRRVPAGDFSEWLRETHRAMVDQSGVDVPCGTCNACCRSSYFIHIGPEETDARSRIPAELLFPAPGRPQGHMLMGFDEHGCCPMLSDGRCSIYEDRPSTCRSYDCRIFTAAGIDPVEEDKQPIAQRTRQWQFSYPEAEDRSKQVAVRAAAAFLQKQAGTLQAGKTSSSTELAVLAVKSCEAFLESPVSRSAEDTLAAIAAAGEKYEPLG